MANHTSMLELWQATKVTRTAKPAEAAKATPAAINPAWYKNLKLSDITIVYGFNGEKRFDAHRFVLCNASQWFMNASSNPLFNEAHDRTITLQEDYPEALDALFEFAYKGKYQRGIRSTVQSFLLHARVFIAADKYMADDLEAWALKKFEDLCKYECESRHMSFFKFAVQQLWEHDNLFGFNQQHSDENARYRKEQEEKGHEDYEDITESEYENDEVYDQSDPGWEIDDDEVDEAGYTSDEGKALDKIANEPESHDPLDRLRAVVVEYILQLLGRGEEDDDPLYFKILCRDIPAFATDFMATMLSGKVRFEYGPRYSRSGKS
ncbi:hypothetical protein HBH51_173210 [Parastagonospora nodorum]|nr:hypothetical protein HBH51_173210 [Parastagonospora nodorum]